jgi:OOP family OmpA-OmpF porin
MLTRARAEVHDGEVILKIGRPPVLRHPETEIFTVYFGLGKTDLASDEIAKVRQAAGHSVEIFRKHGREPEIYVEGHTDRSGSWETNYEIAHRRARSVTDLLLAEGMPESWIHISDYSEEGLAIPTADGVAEERNRRVEITVIPQDQ